MLKNQMDSVVLSNGVKLPCIGFGTWQTPSGEIARDSVLSALRAGYRHIDTATAYGNEKDVGEAIKLSGVKREEIFLTTKHWIADRGYTKTVQAVETALQQLGTEYIDLYLVHWPCVEKSNANWKEINAATWRGFEKMYKDGKIRALGVSNFLPEHIQALWETCEIKPMVNQIEFHPGYNQLELVQWCQEKGMAVEGWSPLGCGAVLKDAFLATLAKKYGKTVAQICIRYALQHNVVPMPKSTHPERIADNLNVFDFVISNEDMQRIDCMPKLGYSGFYPSEAPADTLYGGNYDVE